MIMSTDPGLTPRFLLTILVLVTAAEIEEIARLLRLRPS